jgi:hypothetical protein
MLQVCAESLAGPLGVLCWCQVRGGMFTRCHPFSQSLHAYNMLQSWGLRSTRCPHMPCAGHS